MLESQLRLQGALGNTEDHLESIDVSAILFGFPEAKYL